MKGDVAEVFGTLPEELPVATQFKINNHGTFFSL
jgi:hypothetical protein